MFDTMMDVFANIPTLPDVVRRLCRLALQGIGKNKLY